jgi:hypothetical protein
MRRIAVALLILLLAGCSDGASESLGPPTAPVVSPTPNILASVVCPPGSTGPSSGALTGLGATIGAFAAAHAPQDPQDPSKFGGTVTGGPNDGAPTFTAHCSTGGTIVSVLQNLSAEAPAMDLKTALKGYGIVPPDATLITDTTPSPCETFIYHSDALAAVPDASDPAGTFLVQLNPGADAPGDLDRVATLIYLLDMTAGC